MKAMRCLAMHAVVAGALLAAAPAASGQASVEIVREAPSSEGCGPCDIHLVGESSIFSMPTGVELSTCEDELEGTIGQDGVGELAWTGTPHGAIGCPTNCAADGEADWPLGTLVEVGGEARLTLRVCYRGPGGAEGHCDLVLAIPAAPSHNQELTADNLCMSNTRRVVAAWETETDSHDAIEFVHGTGGQVEVFREAFSEDCGPCDIHLIGESSIFSMPTGVELSTCQDELEGTIAGDGTGDLVWVSSPHGGPGCIVSNCLAAGEADWPLTSLVEVGGEARLTLRVCYRAAVGVESHCDLVLAIPAAPGHDQELTADDLCVSNTRRVVASWETETESHDAIEFVHMNP